MTKQILFPLTRGNNLHYGGLFQIEFKFCSCFSGWRVRKHFFALKSKEAGKGVKLSNILTYVSLLCPLYN